MATYSLPSIVPEPTKQTFELVSNTKTFKSPLTSAIQTVSRKGAHWKTKITWSNLSGEQRTALQGFLGKLNGMEHRVSLRDYGYTRSGNAPGTDSPSLYDDKMGSYIILKNVTGGVSDYLKAGDYISFNNELHIVTQDCSSNSANRVGVYISPPVRKQTTAGDRVEIYNPTAPFIMTNNAQWTTELARFSSISIEAIEDVLA